MRSALLVLASLLSVSDSVGVLGFFELLQDKKIFFTLIFNENQVFLRIELSLKISTL